MRIIKAKFPNAVIMYTNIKPETGGEEEVWDAEELEGGQGFAGWEIKYGVYRNN